MSATTPKPSYYAIIPASVRYADIEPNAKLLYGEITALCDIEGYCWATNEYFAGLYNVEVRVVQNWIKSLKTIKAIKVENPNNFNEDNRRKIWLCDDCQKMFTERRKMQGGVQKNASGTYIYSNTTTESTPIVPKGEISPPPKRRVKTKEPLIQKNSKVWVTETQHQFLLKKAHYDENLLVGWYERLEKWKIEKEITGGNDFKHLQGWVPDAVDSEKRSKPDRVDWEKLKADNKELIGKFRNHFNMTGIKNNVSRKQIKTFDDRIEVFPDADIPSVKEIFLIRDICFAESFKKWCERLECGTDWM